MCRNGDSHMLVNDKMCKTKLEFIPHRRNRRISDLKRQKNQSFEAVSACCLETERLGQEWQATTLLNPFTTSSNHLGQGVFKFTCVQLHRMLILLLAKRGFKRPVAVDSVLLMQPRVRLTHITFHFVGPSLCVAAAQITMGTVWEHVEHLW